LADEYYAFNALESAVHRTKNLLWPVDLGIWLRLAVIAFFVGGGLSIPNVPQYRFSGGDLASGAAPSFPEIGPVVAAVIGAVLLIALLYALVSAAMQFVFVDALRTGDIVLGRFFKERFGKGVRLFLFQLALVLIIFFILAVLFALAFVGPRLIGVSLPALLIGLIPGFLLIALIFGIVLLFTIDFVVPIMIHDDCGVIEGWRRLGTHIAAQVGQSVLYLIVRFVLGILLGIVQAILTVLALLIIAIPFVLIGIALIAVLSVNIVLLVTLLIPYLIIAVPVALLIAVPFITYIRYYSLLVLERLVPGYRILP
jgi:hypothetical protein